MVNTSRRSSAPPTPVGATTLDELTAHLVELRAWAGAPSFSEVVRRIATARAARGVPPTEQVPGRVTVYDCFRPGRQRLDIELVVDIVAALGAEGDEHLWRQAHHSVLREGEASRVVRVHDHLPATSAAFVGRTEELREVCGAGAPVSVIVGMPGVGKTELALQAAHRLAGGYDRHCFVNLRGYTAAQPPADPFAVLEALLRQLGVRAGDVHRASLTQRTALLKQAAAGLRLLLVIDNARDIDQVLPLLPGGPSSRVLVTSRRVLQLPGALTVTVPPLPVDHAVELLAHAAGPDLARDPAAGRLAELCGFLPLHLNVTAGHLVDTPTWTMEDQVRRLESISPEHAVRAALDASYAGLSPAEQRLLRLLPLHPGQGVSVHAAAVLADVAVDEAAQLLERLVTEHLLARDDDGLHHLHDVIDAFAVSLGREQDPRSSQIAAFERLVQYYRRCTSRATYHLRPEGSPEQDGGGPLPDLADLDAAQTWLRLECTNVVATALAADRAGQSHHLTDLAEVLQPWLEADARFGEMEMLFRAVTASDDPVRRRDGARNLGRVFDLTGQLDQALEWSRVAVRGDGGDDIAALNQLGNVLVRMARLDEAVAAFEAGLDAARRSDNAFREGRILGNLGSVHRLLGNMESAEEHFARAVEISRQIDDLENVSIVSTNQSDLFEVLGRVDEGIAALQVSIDLDEHLGLRQHVAGSLNRMALLISGKGEDTRALELLDTSIELATELGEPIYLAEALNIRGSIHSSRGTVDQARRDHLRAQQIGHDTGSKWVVVDSVHGLGEVARQEGDVRAATEMFTSALAAAEEMGSAEATERARAALESCI